MIKILKKILKDKYFIYALLIFFLGLFVNQFSSHYLKFYYNKPLPVLSDFFLDMFNQMNVAVFYDFFIISVIVLFLVYVYREEMKKIPYFLFLFGLAQLIRGIFLVLTPLGSPGSPAGLFNSSAFRAGIYPSGHTMNSFLIVLLSKGKYKILSLIFLILIIIFLILGKGHYSIDIFSGLLFGYAIYSFGEKNLKKFVLNFKK
jgi:membrane-associated phospholipid phosphatase